MRQVFHIPDFLHEPISLAIGADGGCLGFLSSFFSFFFLLLWETEIQSQRAVKPKKKKKKKTTTNQPIPSFSF